MRRGWVLTALMVVVVASGLAVRAFGAADETSESSPTDEPIYYVEGARPAPGATDRTVWVKDGEAPPGCVPYSPDRPASYVCGEPPAGWQPPDPPGTAEDHPEVCATAVEILKAELERLARDLELPATPRIDAAACQAAGLRAPDEDDRGRWLARFPIVNANEVKPYAMAAVFFTLGGGDAPEDRPAVQLSHHRP